MDNLLASHRYRFCYARQYLLQYYCLLCLPDEVCNLVTASSSIAGVDNVGKQASVGKTGVESMNFTFKKLDFDKYGVKRKIVTL